MAGNTIRQCVTLLLRACKFFRLTLRFSRRDLRMAHSIGANSTNAMNHSMGFPDYDFLRVPHASPTMGAIQ